MLRLLALYSVVTWNMRTWLLCFYRIHYLCKRSHSFFSLNIDKNAHMCGTICSSKWNRIPWFVAVKQLQTMVFKNLAIWLADSRDQKVYWQRSVMYYEDIFSRSYKQQKAKFFTLIDHSSIESVTQGNITTLDFVSCYLARRSLCEIINSTLGMLIHRWIGGTLFRTCITLKSKQRESGASESRCFSQMRSEIRPSMFLQKEMT